MMNMREIKPVISKARVSTRSRLAKTSEWLFAV
jgi:hypothetical protein